MFLSKIKSITLCAALVITAGSLLTGCAEQQKEGPEVIYYKMDIPESTVSNKRLGYKDIPELVLIDAEQFFWDYDPFEEEEYGRCETEGDILTAVSADGERQWKTDGTTYEYIFKIQNALLIFDRASSSVPEWESVKDGAVFE